MVESADPIGYCEVNKAWHYIDPTGANSTYYVDPDKEMVVVEANPADAE